MAFDFNSILDIAIGVIFVILMVSMLVSYINEVLAKIFSWRAKTLKEGIGNLLSDPDFTGLGKLVYDHPLVGAFRRRSAGKPALEPSYIPAATFARALVDAIQSHVAAGSPESGTSTTRIQELLETLPEGAGKTALIALAKDANTDLRHFEDAVATWFDQGMDRVSGWYKRLVQRSLFSIALVLCVGLNVNIVSISSTLWEQPQLREQLAARAAESYPSLDPATATPQQAVAAYDEIRMQNGLPVGWSNERVDELTWGMTAGWLVTALLASLGAPFWFNLLGQLLDLRGAGGRPIRDM